MRSIEIVTLALIFTNSWMLAGCGQQPNRQGISKESTNSLPQAKAVNGSAATNTLRSFLARGVIRELPEEGGTVIVRHEEIAGFMPKMTMEFAVRDTNELRGLRAGDVIAFTVKADEEESWIEGIHRAGRNDATTAPAAPALSSLLHVAQLKAGDLLPDAEFLAEDGRTMRFSDFEGRAVAFTFIFSRCPLPDFCPRMNRNFQRTRELLLAKPGGPTNWQFLSISFDPEFDRPAVLTRYAHSYRGSSADRWLFVAAPTNALASLSPQLDFRFANDSGSFAHNLRTIVVDPQRRIYRQFDGNSWKAEDLADAMAEAAKSKAAPSR